MTDSVSEEGSLVREIDLALAKLFPINRSLTGEGNRQTFEILREIIPLKTIEYPSGGQVYDWTVPDEWLIRDAYIKDKNGEKIIDFKHSNLHVSGYSVPVSTDITFAELAPHLHFLEDNPKAIPYRTHYYKRDWSFCVSEIQYEQLRQAPEPLKVVIDSEFKPDGSMTVGELLIPGETDQEYLVSTYCCHPSMANDNLSGLLLTAYLARELLRSSCNKHSWRFIFVPETIGAIAYLCNNEEAMRKIQGGLVATTCGGPGALGYKETFLANHLVDRAINLAFRDRKIEPIRYPFVPDGSDERQFSSPGFRIPTASVTKNKYYEYAEYHTSLDDLEFVNGQQIAESLEIYRDVVAILDANWCPTSLVQNGEPQLGKRDLYPVVGGSVNQKGGNHDREGGINLDAMMWILFLSDGQHDLLSIAERSGETFTDVISAADQLKRASLLV